MKQAIIVALSLMLFAAQAQAETPAERDRYLVEGLAACGNCHTPRGPEGPRVVCVKFSNLAGLGDVGRGRRGAPV
jgi:mono/diheme cytochrome c family protein